MAHAKHPYVGLFFYKTEYDEKHKLNVPNVYGEVLAQIDPKTFLVDYRSGAAGAAGCGPTIQHIPLAELKGMDGFFESLEELHGECEYQGKRLSVAYELHARVDDDK